MSFDIFEVTLPGFFDMISISDVMGYLVCILVAMVIVGVPVLIANAVSTEPFIKKRILFPVSFGLIVFFLAGYVGAHGFVGVMFAEPTVTNVSEVKSAIQREYGIELTDESIQALYSTSGNRYKEYQYVADVDDQVYPYTIVGDSFYFVDKSPG